MPYDIEYEFTIPIIIIEEILENYLGYNLEETIQKDPVVFRRILLDYLINKYPNIFENIDEEKYNNILSTLKYRKNRKYLYIYVTI
ncbi:MAG: hypothetical protein ACP5G1_00320 [Nanopusillaceae archaeon]